MSNSEGLGGSKFPEQEGLQTGNYQGSDRPALTFLTSDLSRDAATTSPEGGQSVERSHRDSDAPQHSSLSSDTNLPWTINDLGTSVHDLLTRTVEKVEPEMAREKLASLPRLDTAFAEAKEAAAYLQGLNENMKGIDAGIDAVQRFVATEPPEGVQWAHAPFSQRLLTAFRSDLPASHEAQSRLREVRADVERQMPPARSHLESQLDNLTQVLDETFAGLPESPAATKPGERAITLNDARTAIQNLRTSIE